MQRLHSEDYERAFRNASQLSMKRPMDVGPKVYMAMALVGMKKYNDAIGLCNESIAAGRTSGVPSIWQPKLLEQKCRALYALRHYK